jgi:hypothetical protein
VTVMLMSLVTSNNNVVSYLFFCNNNYYQITKINGITKIITISNKQESVTALTVMLNTNWLINCSTFCNYNIR